MREKAMSHPAYFQKEGKQWVRLPVPKASTKEEQFTVDLCIDDLPQESTIAEALYKGLKAMLCLGMSEISGDKSPKERELAAEQAQKNLAKLQAGEIRITGGKGKTKTGKLETIAMQKARGKVK